MFPDYPFLVTMDAINHELLIAKLHPYGFSIENVIKLLTRKVAKCQDQYEDKLFASY